MKHHVLGKCILTITMLLLFTTLTAYAACTYSSEGWVVIGSSPASYYSHLRNGSLQQGGQCWSCSAPIITTTCGLSSIKAINFNGYQINKSQGFVVPSENEQTNWELTYFLTANDSYQDGWTSLEARVVNANTNAIIASQTWWGDDINVLSSRKLSFQRNYAGKRLRVEFVGRNPSPLDTIIRAETITLTNFEHSLTARA
jgi:hypothetical protein